MGSTLVEISRDIKALLKNGDQHINGNSDPNLAFDSIFRSPKKRFDPQMLLDPFEKKFDLPAVTIQISHSLCRNDKVVGQKIEGPAGLCIVVFNSA